MVITFCFDYSMFCFVLKAARTSAFTIRGRQICTGFSLNFRFFVTVGEQSGVSRTVGTKISQCEIFFFSVTFRLNFSPNRDGANFV